MKEQNFLNKLDEGDRAKFIHNCNSLNKSLTFEWWVKQYKKGTGIYGAFQWYLSPEGHVYWENINKKLTKK